MQKGNLVSFVSFPPSKNHRQFKGVLIMSLLNLFLVKNFNEILQYPVHWCSLACLYMLDEIILLILRAVSIRISP